MPAIRCLRARRPCCCCQNREDSERQRRCCQQQQHPTFSSTAHFSAASNDLPLLGGNQRFPLALLAAVLQIPITDGTSTRIYRPPMWRTSHSTRERRCMAVHVSYDPSGRGEYICLQGRVVLETTAAPVQLARFGHKAYIPTDVVAGRLVSVVHMAIRRQTHNTQRRKLRPSP